MQSRPLVTSLLLALTLVGIAPSHAIAKSEGTLLGSSGAIRGEIDAMKVRRVARAFSDIRVGTAPATVSPEELSMMLGPEDPVTAGSEQRKELTTVEIETRNLASLHEPAVQAQIPFGF